MFKEHEMVWAKVGVVGNNHQGCFHSAICQDRLGCPRRLLHGKQKVGCCRRSGGGVAEAMMWCAAMDARRKLGTFTSVGATVAEEGAGGDGWDVGYGRKSPSDEGGSRGRAQSRMCLVMMWSLSVVMMRVVDALDVDGGADDAEGVFRFLGRGGL